MPFLTVGLQKICLSHHLEPHNRIEVSNPTAGTIINTTVVELMAPASCDILTADPTLDSVVVIQANETGEYAKAATLTISNPNAKMSDPLWSLIESVSNGQRWVALIPRNT